ncbi:trans-sulfuration enzyme family protein [Paenibacillus sp. MBLB4367]|uniref:trans-sulfuration enzyme family protein n=1 Tax=Paenibacillus sp. MBLB4367 TaxID=3384767 RepID=UPI003907EF50
MSHQNKKHDWTLVAHDGHDERHYGAVTMPIYQNSLFTFPSHDAFEAATDRFFDHYVYTRGNNPTVRHLEERLAALEGGEAARCFGSGMAAITAAIMSAVKSGDHVVCVDQVYGVTKRFLEQYLSGFGVESTFVDGTSLAALEEAIRPNTKLLYMESPTSMRFELQDLREWVAIAKRIGAKTIIDNTWATPCYQKPLLLGVDLSVHSISKYIGGHSDIVGGVVIGSKNELKAINGNEFTLFGGIMSPQNASLVLRGLRTLPLRMQQLQEHGLEVARFLQRQTFVAAVHHPGLDAHPQHELGKTQMSGGGSLFSIELKLPVEQVRVWADKLDYFRIGVSWGGYESLIIATRQSDEQKRNGTVLVRMYVGLEDPVELIGDMRRSFAAAGVETMV